MTPKTPNTPNKRYKTPSRPEVFDAFAEWMAFPPSHRIPRFQKDFAKKHQVSPDTLSDYKKAPNFWELVKEKKQEIHSKIVDAMLLKKVFEKENKLDDHEQR